MLGQKGGDLLGNTWGASLPATNQHAKARLASFVFHHTQTDIMKAGGGAIGRAC